MLTNSELKRKYNITKEDYLRMFSDCGGKCTICGKLDDDTLVVDHCHVTKKVRGLLCHECNSGIGLLGDNRKAVYKVYRYLLKVEQNNQVP